MTLYGYARVSVREPEDKNLVYSTAVYRQYLESGVLRPL